MDIKFGSNGIVMIDNAQITWRNFSGRGSDFNREGARNFALIIPDETAANALSNDKNKDGVGWNVKVRPPRVEGEDPFMFLKVKVKFTARGPKVYLKTNGRLNQLDEDSISILDNVDIEKVDLDIRPYDDAFNGRPFRAAYLESICVTQRVDRFADRYSEVDVMDLPM